MCKVQLNADGCNLFEHFIMFASTSFFLTLVSLETWHFMILYAPPHPQPAGAVLGK